MPYVPFTKEMKETHTILIPNMLPIHFKLVSRILNNFGYKTELLTTTNASIAERFNYHPYYLSQMIKQHTGQSLHQYLIAYRIKMAQKKLTTTNDPISTVAWKSGFQSPAYFIKQFKAHVGVTPNVYRKEHLRVLF